MWGKVSRVMCFFFPQGRVWLNAHGVLYFLFVSTFRLCFMIFKKKVLSTPFPGSSNQWYPISTCPHSSPYTPLFSHSSSFHSLAAESSIPLPPFLPFHFISGTVFRYWASVCKLGSGGARSQWFVLVGLRGKRRSPDQFPSLDLSLLHLIRQRIYAHYVHIRTPLTTQKSIVILTATRAQLSLFPIV